MVPVRTGWIVILCPIGLAFLFQVVSVTPARPARAGTVGDRYEVTTAVPAAAVAAARTASQSTASSPAHPVGTNPSITPQNAGRARDHRTGRIPPPVSGSTSASADRTPLVVVKARTPAIVTSVAGTST